jgi:hypothetical protein
VTTHTINLVTVVIPTFNHGRFLRCAVESALAQSSREREIVVVDDGSTDDSRAVAASYGEAVRYIRQENRGLSAARNTGIGAASGEYIALLDADDVWLPGFLDSAVGRLEADTHLGAVHTGCYCVDESGLRLPQVCVSTVPPDGMYDRLLDGEFFVPSSVVVRRACFARTGLFDETLRASEDWDMWLRVAREYRFGSVDKPLVNYRVHGGNMSGDPDHMLRYQAMVVRKHFGAPEGPADGWPSERRRAYAAVCRYAAQGYYLRGDAELSRRYLCLALRSNPALSHSVDMFYELACGDQPLGRRSVHAPVNVRKNAAFLLSTLDENLLEPELRSVRRAAIAHACLAVGLVAYGRGDSDFARRHLLRALLWEPRLLGRRAMRATLLRATAGPRAVAALKGCLGRERGIGSFT